MSPGVSRRVRFLTRLRQVRLFQASQPLAEAELLCEARAVVGVIWCHHGVAGGQPPLLPVFLRCHAVAGLQVPLEHLQLHPILQADDVVWEHRFADRYGRRRRRRG